MGVKVTFTNKQGARESVILPNRAVADVYARGVRHAVVEEEGTVVEATFTQCREATAEDTRRATNAYFKAVKNGDKFLGEEGRKKAAEDARRERELARQDSAESDAELMAEHFSACRHAGVSQETAFEDWDYVQGRRAV